MTTTPPRFRVWTTRATNHGSGFNGSIESSSLTGMGISRQGIERPGQPTASGWQRSRHRPVRFACVASFGALGIARRERGSAPQLIHGTQTAAGRTLPVRFCRAAAAFPLRWKRRIAYLSWRVEAGVGCLTLTRLTLRLPSTRVATRQAADPFWLRLCRVEVNASSCDP